ncbi:BREX system P-loop protein BrxC [Serratia fonticola]|nr:BREX system P-loop protein BrxC [Serratia fonticola]
MLNREIYTNDPLQSELANNGVAVVNDDQSAESFATLRYELKTFVCDGAYEAGMQKILTAYLSKLEAKVEQSGVWISGFYGSGKSHLAKMLRTFWTNQRFPDGADPLSLAELPVGIREQFAKLERLSHEYQGLHAASGTLGAGKRGNVRLAFLSIIFKSVGLPEQYHLARFVMWLKSQGVLEEVQQYVRLHAKPSGDLDAWQKELRNLYVSPVLAQALLSHFSDLATTTPDMFKVLRAQFPEVKDITNDEMVGAVMEALERNGQLPLTLVVLDEVQQYVGGDEDRAFDVQEVIETCCKASRFKSRLLFVATGQSALSDTPNLQRLMGRFVVTVQLADTDVDAVIRKVILQKKESAKGVINSLFQTNLGEISRHLRGSKFEHQRDDETWMVADYPLLPVRRRFWEKLLPALDKTGTGSQLRNQLRITHEATRFGAEKPLGCIIPADFIYDQIVNDLVNSGVVGQEIYAEIGKLKDGSHEEVLQGRALSLILMISKLPSEIDYGIHATAETLADLLLEDLNTEKHELRPRVNKALEALEKASLIMAVQAAGGVEYRLQTAESQQWYDMYRQQQAELRADPARLDGLRNQLVHSVVRKLVSQVRLTQGGVAEGRTLNVEFGDDLPKDSQEKLYVWAPSLPERQLQELARADSADNGTLYLYIPSDRKSALNAAIVDKQAATMTLDVKQNAVITEAGKEARAAMMSSQRNAEAEVKRLTSEMETLMWLRLSGGSEVGGDTLSEQLQKGAETACIRLYRNFDMADHKGWAKVYDRASREGGENALEAVDYQGEAQAHPVCREVKKFIGVMKTGAEVRERFGKAPYGWSRDAIDGALFAMLAAGVIKASDAKLNPTDARSLERAQVGQTQFRPETVTIGKVQLIRVRSLINSFGVSCNAGEESSKLGEALQSAKALARCLGGEAPLPLPPSTQCLDELLVLSGNDQLLEAYNRKDQLQAEYESWKNQLELVAERNEQWYNLQSLLPYCRELAVISELNSECEALRAGRTLLQSPSPVQPLLTKALNSLRDAITAHCTRYEQCYHDCYRELEIDPSWAKLSLDQQSDLLKKHGIAKLPALKLGNLDEVQQSLDNCSWQGWNDRIAALPSYFAKVLNDAVTLLKPKVRHISLPKPLIETEQDLKDWLAQVEAQVRSELAQGNPVRVS